jgi:hypothetical protein
MGAVEGAGDVAAGLACAAAAAQHIGELTQQNAVKAAAHAQSGAELRQRIQRIMELEMNMMKMQEE